MRDHRLYLDDISAAIKKIEFQSADPGHSLLIRESVKIVVNPLRLAQDRLTLILNGEIDEVAPELLMYLTHPGDFSGH